MKKKNFISRTDADEEFLRKYDVDRRSIFVGNLPADTHKEEIIDLLSPVGEILDVNVIKRPTSYHGQSICPLAGDLPKVLTDMQASTFSRLWSSPGLTLRTKRSRTL